MARGLAAGLADGINNGLQLGMQGRYYRDRAEHWDNMDEARQQKAGLKSSEQPSKGPDREGFMGSLMPIFKSNNAAPAPRQPTMTSQRGLGPDTLPDAGMLSSNPAGAYQTPGLASTAQANPTFAICALKPLFSIDF